MDQRTDIVCRKVVDEIRKLNPSVKIIAACLDGENIMISTQQASKLKLPQDYVYENGSIISRNATEDGSTYSFPFYYQICAR